MAATYIISGLALEQEIIQKLLRRDIMKESVTYQEILREGMAEGKAEGKAEAVNQIALNMLRSSISVDLIAQFTGLSIEQIQKLQ
jgi:predicted transposase/invertase (TIGR01784 family)